MTGHKIKLKGNLTMIERVVICLSEIGGTCLLVYLGCMSCVGGIAPPKTPIPLEHIAFAFGLAVMLSVQTFGHISGSHINPIVSLAAAILGLLPLMELPVFFLGQVVGALIGFILLKMSTPSIFMGARFDTIGNGTKYIVGVCSPDLNPSISVWQGLLVEFMISMGLILICCGVWDSRNIHHDSVPIKFGLAVAVLAMCAGYYTGAHMNPARTFAPALINGDWNNFWVYMAGPFSGCVFASTTYRFVFGREKDEEPPAA